MSTVSELQVYRARDLAAMDPDQLYAVGEVPRYIVVEFDPLEDGTPQRIVALARESVYSAWHWGLYNEFPSTPAKITHHIKKQLGDRTHMDLICRVMWDCYDAHNGELDKEELLELAYAAYDRNYNESVKRQGAYVNGITVLDMLDVIEEPSIKAAIEGINGSPGTIKRAHDAAVKTMRDPTRLRGNPIASGVRAGSIKENQVLQTLVARGKVSDIDSRFFAEPVPSSFFSGLNTLYESMTESRTSTKAAAYKEKPIEDSEYFNRRLQLMGGTVNQLEWHSTTLNEVGKELTQQMGDGLLIRPGDCGTTRTLRWMVKERDLPSLEGKYYHDPESRYGWTAVKENDRDLIGKVINIRSPILCDHTHQQSVCAVCYGELAHSVVRGSNLGQIASVDYGERVTQNMLGIKHVDFAGDDRPILLMAGEKDFMEVIEGHRQIRLKPNLKGARFLLSFAGKEIEQIAELRFVEDVTELPVSRISEVGVFYLTIEQANGDRETVSLNVELENKKSHLSHTFLKFVKEKGYLLTDTGRYLIDITEFDRKLPLFDVPNRDVNILDYLKSIIQFITSTVERKKGQKEDDIEVTSRKMLKNSRTIEEALMNFLDLTSVRMVVNFVHLEILVYSTMVRSVEKRDYRLPYHGNALVFEQLSQVIQNRSMSAAMAFEGHSKVLLNPATYIKKFTPDHILDDLLVPRNSPYAQR